MNNEPLLNVKCFLLDMDGTFNLGDQIIDGSLRFIETLSELGIDYLFLTNNSSKHRRQYAEKITRLGLLVAEEKVPVLNPCPLLVLPRVWCSSGVGSHAARPKVQVARCRSVYFTNPPSSRR